MSMAFCILLCLLMIFAMFGTATTEDVIQNVHCKDFPHESSVHIVNTLSRTAGPSAGPVEKYCNIHTTEQLADLITDEFVEDECVDKAMDEMEGKKGSLVANCFLRNPPYCHHYAIFLGCDKGRFKIAHQKHSGMSTAFLDYKTLCADTAARASATCGWEYQFLVHPYDK